MKLYLCIISFVFQISNLESKIIPDYLPKLCSISTNNYDECATNTLKDWGPYLLNGIKEINFPKMHPLHVPLVAVNRTLSADLAMDAVLRDALFYGFNGTQFKYFKFDPQTKTGELSFNVPLLWATMEYELAGRAYTLDLKGSGYCKGVTSDVEFLFQFKLKTVEKLGINYFTFEKFVGKSTIENGYAKLKSKDPAFQYALDLIADIFNENPRRLLDAFHPVYEEMVTYFFGLLGEQVLSTIPAQEILPE
ncbi:uncharacterized protein LOC116171337 [Photinus pyralis]|uniref:Uncharacterized protein n=1 Tax=Photinus pyralis TaxID=7054 RepID=A0A1Y1MPP6_PHOPY|nr:uncharacterized protein LOC116171337 [Photinus pyralis]